MKRSNASIIIHHVTNLPISFQQQEKIMNRRKMIATGITTALAMPLATTALANEADTQSEQSLETAMAFMGAMGKGDMQTMGSLMADDMVCCSKHDILQQSWAFFSKCDARYDYRSDIVRKPYT